MGTLKKAMFEAMEKRDDKLREAWPLSEDWFTLQIERGVLNADGQYYLSDGMWISASTAIEMGLIS